MAQFLGFPRGALSIQPSSVLSGASGHLRESVKHGHRYLSNHGESGTKNIDRESPQHKQFSGREKGGVMKAWLTCHTPLKLHKTDAVNLRILHTILASLSACVLHTCSIRHYQRERSPEHWGTWPWPWQALLTHRRHLTSVPLKME